MALMEKLRLCLDILHLLSLVPTPFITGPYHGDMSNVLKVIELQSTILEYGVVNNVRPAGGLHNS